MTQSAEEIPTKDLWECSCSLFTEKLICSLKKVSLITLCDGTVLVNHKAEYRLWK